MRCQRATVGLVGLVALACAACGRDFDGLFADGAGAADGGTVPDGGTLPDGAPACVPSGDCGTKSACDEGTCDLSCACGCTCPRFSCPRGNSAKRCRATCNVGSTCDIDCDVDGTCELASHGGKARFNCKEQAGSCKTTCDQGASCDLRCDLEGSCSMECAAGSACVLTCSSRPSSCDLTCAGGTKKDCGGRVFACNADCPN
jgi:hypothetical protein